MVRLAALLLASGCSSVLGIHDFGAPVDAVTPVPADGPVGDDAPTTINCPSNYSLTLDSSSYRYITNGRTFWQHYDDCRDDAPGGTHLAVPNSTAELAFLSSTVTDGNAYVGIVQMAGQPAVGQGWFGLDGVPIGVMLWEGGAPNDGDGSENDHENVARVADSSSKLDDARGNDTYQALCECDKKPIAPNAQMIVDNDPNHP